MGLEIQLFHEHQSRIVSYCLGCHPVLRLSHLVHPKTQNPVTDLTAMFAI